MPKGKSSRSMIELGGRQWRGAGPGHGGLPLAPRFSERLGVIRLSLQFALWVGPRDRFRQVLRQAPFGIQ